MIQIGAYVKDILNCKTRNKNKVLQLFSVTYTGNSGGLPSSIDICF